METTLLIDVFGCVGAAALVYLIGTQVFNWGK